MYLTQALHRAVQHHPNKVATHFGTRTRTFRELADRVSRLAGGLRRLGMRQNDRVAMLALNSDRYLEYQLAVPWGGGVINPCNVRWSAAEIAYSLRHSESSILLVDDAFSALVDPICRAAPGVREVVYTGERSAPAGMHDVESLIETSDPVPDSHRCGDALLGVFYTGGTTGFPKGVMLSHDNVCSSALAVSGEGVAPRGAIYLHAAPMFHIADFGVALAHYLAGNTHVIIPGFTPAAMIESIERHGVTDVLLVPTMIQMLSSYLLERPDCGLKTFKRLFYGASPISEAALDRAMSLLPGVEFYQGYGMTELSPLATLNPAYYHSAEGRSAGKVRSAGRASLCTEVRIVDPDDVEVPRGEVGEIVVRGPNVMLGYWNDSVQTDAALRGGWMHTGDCGHMDDDGFVSVVDRIKDMIKCGGENVFSAEVENAVADHPAVAACAVIAIPNELWGEAVHAVIVTKPGATVSLEQVIEHCRERIAGYKCPRSVEFREALPISGAGKVLKTELRKPFWEGRDRQIA